MIRTLAAAAALAAVAGLGVVPAVASAGPSRSPDVDPLARFTTQPVEWGACQAAPDDEEGAALDEAGARCAEIAVPLDHARPGGRTITLAVSRLAATTEPRLGPLMINLGGPGIPVFGRVVDAALAMGDVGARFDLIGMDPRFVGRSTPLDCDWPSSWSSRAASNDTVGRLLVQSAELAARCARHRELLRHASSTDIARDMDIVRAVLGAPRLSYVGYSYGTYHAALYAQLFPQRVGRLVLDSAIDPADPGVRLHADPAPAREAALREWAAWAAARDTTYHLGATADEVLGVLRRVHRAAAQRPLRVGPYRVDATVVPGLLLDPLSDDTDDELHRVTDMVLTLERARAEGSATPSDDLAEALAAALSGAASAQRSAQTAISCADLPVPRDLRWHVRDVRNRTARSPFFGGVGRVTPCAFWPAPVHRQPAVRNEAPALVVQADGDINATLDQGQAMHRAMRGSRMITVTDTRTHGVYLFLGNPCVDDAVGSYLLTGQLPPADLSCAG